ncbi:MAG: hypothetical protein MUE48_10840 [Desulfobacterales bacterium]|nr:hypothetical protein [Desulfobacterales bacterium]
MMPACERRAHARSWFLLGRALLAARMRTGSPLRVLNTSPDGMLVESPARLLPGTRVDLILQSGTTREQTPWFVVHSRVGCLRGSSDIRYRVGLRRASGTNYPTPLRANSRGQTLPAGAGADPPTNAFGMEKRQTVATGTEFVSPDPS